MQMRQRAARLLQVRETPGDVNLKELYGKTMNIALPATLEGALLSIIGSVDTMMVGTLGSAAIAAVGLTSQPRMIMLILAQALCVGVTAIVARRKGADDQQGARQCLKQSLVVVTGLGVLIAVLGWLLAEPLMLLAGANEETLALSTDYFRVISLGFLSNCWSLCICAALRAIGHARVTMAVNLTANGVNVVLNYLLIGGNLGFPAMGVHGAAVATTIGTITASLLAFSAVLKPHHYLYLAPREKVRFDRETLQGLTKVGSSSIAESVFLRVGFLMVAKMIAGLGTEAFAAYQIVQQVASLSFTLGDGIGSAGAAMVGQSLGAGRRDVAMTYARIARRVSLFASLALMAVICLCRRSIAGLFTSDAQIIADVSLAFIVVLVGIIPQNGRVVYSGCLRGAGDVKFVAMISLLSVMILRPALTYLFCYPLREVYPAMRFAVTGQWLAFVIDAFVRDFLLAARVKKGKWLNVKL